MSRLRCALLAVCALLHTLAPLPGRADDGARARQAFEQGVAASEANDWRAARAAFDESQRLAPKATTLFNLALSELRLELHTEALATLRAFDALADPELHQHLIDRAGAVRLEAEAMAARARIRAIEQDLEREARTTVATVTPDDVPARGTGRVLSIAGGALAAGAVGAAFWWRDRARNLDACRLSNDVTCREEQQIERQERSSVALTITLGTAAVGLLATGAVWLVTRGRAGQARVASRRFAPSGAGAALRF